MTEEKFKLWKLALGLIHLDGKVTREEQEWFDARIESIKRNKVLQFSDEQISELKSILLEPIENYLEDFRQLKKPADCALLVHFVRIVGHLDQDFSSKEKALLELLETECLAGVDMNTVRAELAKVEKNIEASFSKPANMHSIFENWLSAIVNIL